MHRTDPPPADYDPDRTVMHAYDADEAQERTRVVEPEPPVEETKLLELEPPVEQTKLLDWKSVSIPQSPSLVQSCIIERANPISSPVVVVRVTADATAVRRRAPLPLWVHIALASAFVCCVVLLSLLVVMLKR